jgi:hypothetical protein
MAAKENKMKLTRVTLFGCFMITACCSAGVVQAATIQVTTDSDQARKWRVEEIRNGHVVSKRAVFMGSNIWGHVNSITVPFTYCDGYWRAVRRFHIPIGATNLVLHITALGVDDRAVIKLNGTRITSVGTTANGEGDMQFHDPGENVPYNFQFIAGNVSFTDKTHLKTGRNDFRVIVNNTYEGINGTITPITKNDPSGFGIKATVTYTP